MPRRAAVSAFGFGGINAHLLIEEWLPEMADIGETIAVAHHWLPPSAAPTPIRSGAAATEIAVVGMDARFGPWRLAARISGADLRRRAQCGSRPLPERGGVPQRPAGSGRKACRTPRSAASTWTSVTVPADQFRIPPRELEEMLPQQLLMLQSAAAAIADAGLDREGNLNTGVFIGIALDLNSTNFSLRWSLPEQARCLGDELGRDLRMQPNVLPGRAELQDAAVAAAHRQPHHGCARQHRRQPDCP